MNTDERAQARARCNAATKGPWTKAVDARTDLPAALDALDAAEAEVERLREVLHLGAELDNHHNAAWCPYCTPSDTQAEVERLRAEVVAAVDSRDGAIDSMIRQRVRAEKAEAEVERLRAQVARVEVLADEGVWDVRMWGERLTPYSRGADEAFRQTFLALRGES